MTDNPFRILLDFRELNFKFYKFVWMSVLPCKLVTIKDLKDEILKRFSLPRTDVLLFLRDGLLPEDENISNILRENDSVRLFYDEPPSSNLTDSRILYDGVESSNGEQVKSPKKRKEHSDILQDNDEQIESNKKRKHSFSNGTYLFKDNCTPENSTLIRTLPADIENVTNVDLFSIENGAHESCRIKKKLKYSHDVSQNSLVSESEIAHTSDISMPEKNQSKINFCKKKKKHKHSKEASESEIIFHDDINTMSEIRKKKSKSLKKKKGSIHSLDASKIASVSEYATPYHDETIGTIEKLNDSGNNFETRNELAELGDSVFKSIIDDSEVLNVQHDSLCAPSTCTSSGVGHSLKTSLESNQQISSENNCSKSYDFNSKAIQKANETNLSLGQGNSCKKKKRKRHRKRKSLLISPEVELPNNCSLDMSSPQKNENADSLLTTTSYQTPEISPSSKETLSSSKSNAFYSSKGANCLPTKRNLIKPFGNFLPSTSTPVSQSHTVSSESPRGNVSKMSSGFNAPEDQSCSTSVNTILPAIQKIMKENCLSARSSPCILTKNKTAAVPNHILDEKISTPKTNNSGQSSDLFSNIRVKSGFLDRSLSYKDCPPLNSCPLVGTRIAYKILELDVSYSPVVSNYKEGTIKAINSQTDELEIELTEPEVKEGRLGKFENLYEDELPSCEVIGKVTVSWSSLIDPVQVIF